MKRTTYILHILQVLIPILFLVVGLHLHGKLVTWLEDLYPFILWPLFVMSVALVMIGVLVTTGMAQTLWFVVLPLTALVAVLGFVTLGRNGMR